MRIGIDLQACQTECSKNRGIGFYSFFFTKALLQNFMEEEKAILLLNGEYPNYSEINQQFDKHPKISKRISYHYLSKPFLSSQSWQKNCSKHILAAQFSRLPIDVLHICSLFEGTDFSRAISHKSRLISSHIVRSVILYDLIPLIFKHHYLSSSNAAIPYYGCLGELNNFDIVLAISEATRQDAINYLNLNPDRVINIGGGINEAFRIAQLSAEEKVSLCRKYGINGPFLMYTGGIDFRKNIEGIIKAYTFLPKNIQAGYQLVIVCKINDNQKSFVKKLLIENNLHFSQVLFTNYVPEIDLIKLYNICDLFIFPSLYEGLGLPVLEAMACGAAVIGGNNSSIKEIINRNDALFDASNPRSIAEKIHEVLINKNFKQELSQYSSVRIKDFSWEKTAQISLDAMRQAVKRKKNNFISFVSDNFTKPKIAFLSPLPNQKSGISFYSAELLPFLQRHFDIDLFVDSQEISDPYILANFNVFHYSTLAERVSLYDEIIYQFGNSEFHAYMYDLLQKYSGVVILHDFFLSGLICHLGYAQGSVEDFFKQELFYCHDFNADEDWKKYIQGEKTLSDLIMQFPINKRVIESAHELIVHSSFIKKLFKQYYCKDDIPNFHVIPSHASVALLPPSEQQILIRKKLNIQHDALVTCSFGILAPTKLNEVIISGFHAACLANPEKNLYLIFVGSLISENYERVLKQQIALLGLAERVIITGFVDKETYNNYLSITNIGIQLRGMTRGETSAAILNCLSYGIPLIVNDYATTKDYPAHIMHKINEASEESLASALNALINDRELRHFYHQNSRSYAAEVHNLSKIAEQYARVIMLSIIKKKACNDTFLAKNLQTIISNYNLNKHELELLAKYASQNNLVEI